MKELLNELCNINAISGFEHMGNKCLAEIFERELTDVQIDCNGNVSGYLRCGKKNAPLVLFEAHFDVIGLMVKTIEEGGFVTVISIGGVDPRILPGIEVVIHGKQDVYGVMGIKPPHIQSAEEMSKGIELEDIAIDTGYTKQELEKLIDVGSIISIKTKHFKFGQDKFCGGGLDDRAGVAAIFSAAKMLKNANINADICVLAATTEETKRHGARAGAYSHNPDLAVVVDVTHGETPDGIKERTSKLGEGPVICFGPNLDRKYTKKLIEILEKNNIPYQTEVESGDTGTDAWVIQIVNEGVPCVLLSIPLRYMHTNVETIALKDLENTSRAMAEFIKYAEVEGCLKN